MPRVLSAPFFSATPIFDRAEYAHALGRHPGDKGVSTLLTHHLRAGNIRRIARGVFASVPAHADAAAWPADRFLAASRLRRGGVIAYYSALELWGCGYTVSPDIMIASAGQPGVLRTAEFTCRFTHPSAPYETRDLESIDRLGLAVLATNLECTIADLFDCPERCGGADELIHSLDLVHRVDSRRIAERLSALGNAAAAGAAGWWLERNAERLNVAESTLARLHHLAPKQNRYALGAKVGSGRLARDWRVILPESLWQPTFEGLA